MIINGGSRSNGRWFAKHLMNTKDNDRVEVMDMRGLVADQVPDAFREMQAVASGTQCKNYFYHATINPRDAEHLTPAEWALAVDRLEKNLGLEGQACVVVEHEKKGRVHRHVIWSRIDLTHMKAIRMDDDYALHQRTSRELEKAFDLERGCSVLGVERDGPRPERRPQQWEMFRGQQSGIDPNQIRADMTRLWGSTTNGATFAAALEAEGYLLAKGDRRDFCVIDQAGHEHSLARRLSSVKAAPLRARLADLDRDALPSVAEGRALHKTRMMEQEAERTRLGAQLATLSMAGALHQAALSTQVPVLDLQHTEVLSSTPTPDDSVTLFQEGQERAQDVRAVERLEAQRDATPHGEPTLEKTITGAGDAAEQGIMVAGDLIGQVASKLADVVSHFLDLFVGVPAPRKISDAEFVRSAAARQEDAAQQRAAAQRNAALDQMSAQLKQGPRIEQAAVGALSYSDLQQINDQGDDGLRALVRQREAELLKYYSFGHTRERIRER